MARALELALAGRGSVEPNPTVGAVIVRDGKIIGEGFHRKFGRPHAEVEAILDAQSRGQDVRGDDIYVTLEPCCHHGKTPPCTEKLIEFGFKRVVAAMRDPDPKVAGKGIAALGRAGIEVVVGVMEERARELLGPYIKTRTLRRPWVICKWAQTLDGRIATHTGHSQWITSPAAREEVHRVRSWCDGICVGVGTVLADDPMLTNRSGQGRRPARLVLDADLQMPVKSRLVQSARETPLLIATTSHDQARMQAMQSAGAEVLCLPAAPFASAGHGRPNGNIDLGALLDELGRRNWTYLLVEGGRSVLGQFLAEGLADELLVFIAPRILGGKSSLGPVDWPDVDLVDKALQLPAPEVRSIGPDTLLRFVLNRY